MTCVVTPCCWVSGDSAVTPIRRSASSASTSSQHPKKPAGDLTTGRAFDNGCKCHESNEGVLNGLVGRLTQCHCGALRLRSQLEFIRALINIGKKLQSLETKELRGRMGLAYRHDITLGYCQRLLFVSFVQSCRSAHFGWSFTVC